MGDEEEVDPEQEQPMDIETEAEGQPSSSRRGGARGKCRASLFLAVPPDAFQIILERIDGLREVQIEHFDRLTVRISAFKSYYMMLCMLLCMTLCMT